MVSQLFSIVIPTYNRAEILKRSLRHLLQLRDIGSCEIIIVNDGSSDATSTVVEEYRNAWPNIVRHIEISNGGPARARNHGVREARMPRILFIDDDVFPREGLLQEHWKTLDKGFTGSQGILVWHEDIAITPLVRYIDSRGSQFAFDRIADPEGIGFQYVYTGNFATYRDAVVDSGGFDESFYDRQLAFSAFEDTILGYRLTRGGRRLAFTSSAIADHLHKMTEDGFLQREYKVGFISQRLKKSYPDVAQYLGIDKNQSLLVLQTKLLQLLTFSRLGEKVIGFPLFMYLRHREAFLRGVHQAQLGN